MDTQPSQLVPDQNQVQELSQISHHVQGFLPDSSQIQGFLLDPSQIQELSSNIYQIQELQSIQQFSDVPSYGWMIPSFCDHTPFIACMFNLRSELHQANERTDRIHRFLQETGRVVVDLKKSYDTLNSSHSILERKLQDTNEEIKRLKAELFLVRNGVTVHSKRSPGPPKQKVPKLGSVIGDETDEEVIHEVSGDENSDDKPNQPTESTQLISSELTQTETVDKTDTTIASTTSDIVECIKSPDSNIIPITDQSLDLTASSPENQCTFERTKSGFPCKRERSYRSMDGYCEVHRSYKIKRARRALRQAEEFGTLLVNN